ncbi:MAG: ribokinase [Bauldia sp.]|uniref:ribokinase n=1 Tax=Bauldia sp. TaxID=2575872 RepID=UPI001D5D7DB5|nr:ribokinase [Bauldia sp.]MCB1496247.1 ribokinase [Bauldia sp.]
MTEEKSGIAILGVFVADLAFRADRMPAMGETIFGTGFKMGPGGKGSNQSVAAARLGARVTFISRLGQDDFGAVAQSTWRTEGITARIVESPDGPTGAAFIYVNERTGENAIIVAPGVAESISAEDVESAADAIRGAAVFVTQLEQPAEAAHRALEIARAAGVATVFNPAPAAPVDDTIYALCDYVTPNESEAAFLTNLPVTNVEEARKAGDVFLDKGAGTALITLGEAGALLHTPTESTLVPAFEIDPVVETAGAGDAFNGGFAAALAMGMPAAEAARFGCATAGLSVTRHGTAPSMPTLAEVEALLARR